MAGAVVSLTLSSPAVAQVLVLNDPLQGNTCGIRNGGTFAEGGWKITSKADWIYWHLDENAGPFSCLLRPGTVSKGAVEFSVKRLNPNESRPGLTDKSELFHMYDYTYENADTNYGGYRNNPFKHFIRKIGIDGAYKNVVNALELVLVIAPNYQEPDTRNLSWDPNTTYVFREEWGPDGQGNCVFKTYRDGILEKTMTEPGSWSPFGHSVRIGMARMDDWSGAPIDAVFSNVKVWDLETAIPNSPVVTYPGVSATVDTRTPRIRWAWTPTFNHYQVRITTGDSPTSGIVWDSGEVVSVRNYADTGTLTNLANYYVWVRLGNVVGWTNWSAAGQWFKVDTSYTAPNYGITRLVGNALHDDQGPYPGLGFTYMEGLGFCKHDRNRFESDVAFMASRGFNYMRILSEVPGACDQDYWYGRSINASNYTCQHGIEASEWPDYDQQFKEMVDIAYDRYGIRTEVTIFGGAGESFPTYAGREAHCQRILNLIAGREHKIAYIEIANEAWQTGFPWPQGRTDLRSLCDYVAARTEIPVAITSMNGTNADMMDLYLGTAAGITTEHFDRNCGTFEGGWLPVRDPWRVQDAVTAGVPPVSSDEPIGPGSSVCSETDPIKLVSAACFAWIAKLPSYVLHSRAGVRGDYRFEDMSGVNDFRHLRDIIPSDMPNWTRNDGKETAAPFTVYCDGYANQYWTDPGRSGATTGCHRNIGGSKCLEFVCYPQGIRAGGVTLQARRDMSFNVYHPMTGAIVDSRTLLANQSLTLAQGPGAYIIKGTFPGGDAVPPGPATKFAANAGDGQNILTWRNPGDTDFWGMKIVYRTDRYPTSESDGAVVCDRTSGPGANDWYTHTGLTNGVACYYAAFAYDCLPNHSTAATTTATPLEGLCFSDSFTYPNGDLNGNDGWNGSAGPYIRIANDTLAIEGSATSYDAIRTVSCTDPGTGYIKVAVKVRSGFGGATMWSLWCDDPSGKNLARWYGGGTTARGRIGDSGIVTDLHTLTGNWDTLIVKIDPTLNTSEFLFNGASIGTLDHSSTGAGDTLGRLRFETVANAGAAGHYLYFDDLRVGEPLTPGDFDHDEDVDQADFGIFQRCISGNGQAPAEGCDVEDLDRDGDVDQDDVIVFQGCMGGSDSPPGC
jgi:hypothetical protein